MAWVVEIQEGKFWLDLRMWSHTIHWWVHVLQHRNGLWLYVSFVNCVASCSQAWILVEILKMGTTVRTVGSKHSRVEEGFVGWFSQTQQQLCDIFPLSTLGKIGSFKPGFLTIQPAVPLRRMVSGSQHWHCWRSRYVFVFRAVTELERLFFNVTHVLDRLKVSRYSFHMFPYSISLLMTLWVLEETRQSLRADVISYNAVISACEKAAAWEEALIMLCEIVRRLSAKIYMSIYVNIFNTSRHAPISNLSWKSLSSDNKTSHLQHACKNIRPEAKALPPASWASVQPSVHAEKQSNGQRPYICSRVASISMISMRGRTHSQKKTEENKNGKMIGLHYRSNRNSKQNLPSFQDHCFTLPRTI